MAGLTARQLRGRRARAAGFACDCLSRYFRIEGGGLGCWEERAVCPGDDCACACLCVHTIVSRTIAFVRARRENACGREVVRACVSALEFAGARGDARVRMIVRVRVRSFDGDDDEL
eukprot:6210382-Pleurochrysis_carterae.AAC.1